MPEPRDVTDNHKITIDLLIRMPLWSVVAFYDGEPTIQQIHVYFDEKEAEGMAEYLRGNLPGYDGSKHRVDVIRVFNNLPISRRVEL